MDKIELIEKELSLQRQRINILNTQVEFIIKELKKVQK